MAGRAGKGGEYGKNGQYYAGGQYLPNTELPKMPRSTRKRGSGKQEIAPYTWEVPPTDGYRSIYKRTAGILARPDWEGDFHQLVFSASEQTLGYFQVSEREARELVAQYNAGSRWVRETEDGTREYL